jgi:hypothetical protein
VHGLARRRAGLAQLLEDRQLLGAAAVVDLGIAQR